jgi:signal transduction histidine kinase
LNDEPVELINHLQDAIERERVALARLLHDELGGLLVSAVMDLGWVAHHLDAVDDIRQRLNRVRDMLAAAIAMKRNMIEELRPSLLDNLGLFAACQWHLKQSCKVAGILCTDEYPAEELKLKPEACTGLFRIMQETLAMVFKEHAVRTVDVRIAIEAAELHLKIAHGHETAETTDVFEHLPMDMAAITHRVAALGGRLTVQRRALDTVMTNSFPLDRTLAVV